MRPPADHRTVGEHRSPLFGLTAPFEVNPSRGGSVIREASLSQHNITKSEAFDRSPFVIIRSVRAGGMRRKRTRMALAFAAGAAVTVILGIGAAVVAFGPSLGT